MDEIVVDLKANNEEERICEFVAMIEHVQTKINDNQRAVKEKMEKVIADAMAAATPTLAEERTIKMKEEKVKIIKDFIEDRCRILHLSSMWE